MRERIKKGGGEFCGQDKNPSTKYTKGAKKKDQ